MRQVSQSQNESDRHVDAGPSRAVGSNDNGNGRALSPRKDIVGVVERNEQSYWTKIGVAFENRDGSWLLRFDYVPSRPEVKIQLREPLPPREPREEN